MKCGFNSLAALPKLPVWLLRLHFPDTGSQVWGRKDRLQIRMEFISGEAELPSVPTRLSVEFLPNS